MTTISLRDTAYDWLFRLISACWYCNDSFIALKVGSRIQYQYKKMCCYPLYVVLFMISLRNTYSGTIYEGYRNCNCSNVKSNACKAHWRSCRYPTLQVILCFGNVYCKLSQNVYCLCTYKSSDSMFQHNMLLILFTLLKNPIYNPKCNIMLWQNINTLLQHCVPCCQLSQFGYAIC